MSTGNLNAVVGYGSGRDGTNNSIVGSFSGTSITTGEYNTILGSECGTALTTGVDNILVGSSTGDALESGDLNILIGYSAGEFMTAGFNNVCIGPRATTSDGSYNICIGEAAGTNVSGQRNVCIGENAGNGPDDTGTNGENNLMIGKDIGGRLAFYCTYIGDTVFTGSDLNPTSSVLQNTGVGRNIEFGTTGSGFGTYSGNIKDCVAFGSDLLLRPAGTGPGLVVGLHDVSIMGQDLIINRGNNMSVFGRRSNVISKSNLVSICNADNFVTLAENGDFTAPGAAYKLTAGGWLASSDRRLKSNIHIANTILCENIMRGLDLKRFTWNNDFNPLELDRTQLGFIAQEVEEFLPKSVTTKEAQGLADSKFLDPTQITMVMYGALRRCMTRIDELEAIVARNNLQ
jgi:hypothetical protein